MIKRPLDHLVLCVRDLDAARRTYERLGFTLTPKAVHPFGTANSLIQFNGNFLELLTVIDRRLIKPVAPGEFAFAAFNDRFLADREDRKSTRLNSSHDQISYAVFCLKKKK